MVRIRFTEMIDGTWDMRYVVQNSKEIDGISHNINLKGNSSGFVSQAAAFTWIKSRIGSFGFVKADFKNIILKTKKEAPETDVNWD